MAHSLQLEIVAEGIEDEVQLEFLRQKGVKIIQGFLFSPPVPAKEFRIMLQNQSAIMKHSDKRRIGDADDSPPEISE